MDIVSIGPVDGGPEELRRQLATVEGRIPGRKVTVLYLPIDCDHRAFLAAAGDGVRGPVVGATTGGAAFTERGVTRTQPVAAVLGGRDFDCAVAVATDLSDDPRASISSAVQRLVQGARRTISRSVAVLTLADAFACDGEVLLSALESSTPPHWRFFGGTAGDDWKFNETFVFANGELLQNAAVMVAIFGETGPSIAARHGFRPAEGARELTITEIEGAKLKRLDDEPAADVYRRELERLGLLQPGDDLIQKMATYELGTKTIYGNELRIRVPLSIDDDGSVMLASSLPLGTIVRVVSAGPEQLINAAGELSARALAPLSSSAVRGALIFDCGARLQLLRDRYEEQVSAFLGGRNFPCVGMAGYGEIAKFGGSVEGFHNTTAVMAAW